MRVLVTGMTSVHCSRDAHRKTGNFTGYLVQALRELGHEVDWRDPRISDDLDRYDRAIIGVAPVGSLGANRCYGALDTISHLIGTEKLLLLVDAPDPEKIEVGMSSVLRRPVSLFKEFFRYRKEYELAVLPENAGRLLETLDYLQQDTWPRTLVPALPWTLTAAVEERLPAGARGRISLHCLDDLVREASEAADLELTADRPEFWAYEPSSDTRWLGQQHVSLPVVTVPRSSKVECNGDALVRVSEAVGCLIAPDRKGLWWNTRFAQSLARGTPVFTDWTEAQFLDPSFAVLPSSFEHDRDHALVETQRKVYFDEIGDRDRVYRRLDRSLRGE